MAITHFGNKMLRGTKVDRVSDSLGSSADGANTGITLVKGGGSVTGSPTTDLSSAIGSWTKVPNSGSFLAVDSGNNEIDVAYGSSADHAISYDLGGGSNLGTKFTVRFEYQITGYSGLGNYMQFAVGLTDGTSSCIRNSSDLFVASNTAGSSLNRWRLHVDHSDQVSGGSGADSLQTMSTTSSATTYYIELTRDGDTFGLTFFTDNTYTTVSESKTGSTSETIDLRYLQASIYQESSGSGTYTSSIRNIKYWNNQARFHSSKLGTGAYSLDGNDYVEVNGLKTIFNGATKLSVAGWIYPRDNVDETLLGQWNGSGNSDKVMDLHINGSNKLELSLRDGGTNYITTSSTSINENEWQHVAMTYDGATTTVKLYINGTLDVTDTSNPSSLHTGTGSPALFGIYGDKSSNGFDGILDDWGCWSRVLTATEISDLVNKTGYTDGLGSSVNGTNQGTTSTSNTPIYGQTAISLNGSSQYADSFGSTSSFASLTEEDFTIAFWLKAGDQSSGNFGWVMGTGNISGSENGFIIGVDWIDNETFYLNVRGGGTALNDVATNAIFSEDDYWHHYVFRFDNTNEELTIFKDGANTATQTISYSGQISGNPSTTHQALRIGRQSSSTRYYDGDIADIGIWKRLLTTGANSEVSTLFNTMTTSLTTATSSATGKGIETLSNKTGLLAHYKCDNTSWTNSATSTINGALVSSLTNKSGLKAHYTMDTQGTQAWGGFYETDDFSVSSQDNQPRGIGISHDGTYLYMCGDQNHGISQYTMSTPYDLTTISHTRTNTSDVDNNPRGVAFNDDGTLMFVNYYGGTIKKYSLTTAYDISTMGSADQSNQYRSDNSATGLFFKPDGTKFYVTFGSDNDIKEFDCNGAWDVSSTSYNNVRRDSLEGDPTDVWISSDGLRLWYCGYDQDKVKQWNLATAWDISSGSENSTNFSVTGNPFGLVFKPDGTKFFTVNDGGDEFEQYSGGKSCPNDFSSTSNLEAMTNLPENTIFLQTDDTPSYWWKQSDNTWKKDPKATVEENFSSSSGWTLNNSAISNNSITCTGSGESYKAITGVGKPDKLTWDFTWTRKSGDAGNTSSFLLTSHTGGYSDPSSGHTNVQFYMPNGNATWLSVRKNSGSGNVQTECNLSSGIQDSGTTKYYRITKDGTLWTLKRFGSASNREGNSNVEDSATATMSSSAVSTWNTGSGDLTYILVDGHGSGTKNYTISDVKIWKDVAL